MLTRLSYCGLLMLLLMTAARAERSAIPAGFVYLDQYIPGIQLDIRYKSADNFIGRPIRGYGSPSAILSLEAAAALRAVQADLAQFSLGLKVFDAYRPQRAVDHFVDWAKDLDDQKMKTEFYPGVGKNQLFEKGYIAGKSSHSRGSTVDITIISLLQGEHGPALDMGSPFDFFGPESWPDYPGINTSQRAHRMLLNMIMSKHGFAPYPQEWWHFTLQDEPYPNEYFDFPIP